MTQACFSPSPPVTCLVFHPQPIKVNLVASGLELPKQLIIAKFISGAKTLEFQEKLSLGSKALKYSETIG